MARAEKYSKANPLKVATLCSGYDSQCMALDRNGIPYELVAWSEIDKYAIAAHNECYPQWADRNLGDMSQINWDEFKEDIDLLTYSTPCTDISNAGLQKGIAEDSGTRSSLLWYTRNCIIAKKPKYLLMENVKALVSKKFMPDFQRWLEELESYGYYSKWAVLNSKDYGIPQNRERVFCLSILKTEEEPNPEYFFPEPFPLELRLEDVLEKKVDESYYLSQKSLDYFFQNSEIRYDAED